ncbi:MAG: Abi family protein [Syntrophorhabdales bacterium]|jgi:abortive infection bacteriophage resistance protein
MTVPYTKPALTFDEQLNLLAERGLIIENRAAALNNLSKISYYRFSGYCLPFKDYLDHFRPGTTWERVMELYEFDRKLRILAMDAVERVEVAIRTEVTYTLAHTYGPFCYLDPACFRSSFQHAQWLDKLTVEVRKSRETFIRHFREKYDGFPGLPIWMATEVMSFGSLSRLYEGMKSADQQKVSSLYDIPRQVLHTWLRTLAFIRNICAHHGRLWNRELAVAPEMPTAKHGWAQEETPNQKRLFAVLVILRHLLLGQDHCGDWCSRITDLLDPIATEDRFRRSMGLPENWKSHKRWETSGGGE